MEFSSNLRELIDCNYLHVAIDVESVVFGSEDNGSILHQGDVEALGVLDLALKGTEQLPGLTEDGEVEVVVIVRDADLP